MSGLKERPTERSLSLGVPLIPQKITYVRHLDSEGINQEQYDEALKQYSGKALDSLKVLSVGENGLFFGSNDFVVPFIQSFFREGTRLASLPEFGQALNANPKYFLGAYTDPAIVLRAAGDRYQPNDYIAKNLAKKVNKRKIKDGNKILKVGNVPLVIPFGNLRVVEDENSAYGLVYDFKDDVELGIIPASMFADNAQIKRFSKYDENTGLPVPNLNGNYSLFTRNDGISGLCVDIDGLDSDRSHLAYSNPCGRVVVSAEGTSQKNLEVKVFSEIDEQFEAEQRELSLRYERARQVASEILKGKE